MMRNIAAVFVAGLLFVAPSQSEAKKKPQLTPMELQALQSHEYETSKEVLFASVVSVFQDLGYQLENADMPSGFITASSATQNKTNFLEAFAGQRSSGNTRATAFVEAMPNKMARVRLNFLNSKSSSSAYGQQSKNDKPILDPLTYKVAWDKIDEAIFVRNATNASAQPGTPATATASPAAISVPVTPGTSVTVVNPPKN
ncbi:hypothetical protein M0208_16945 [Sphingomonas sp. SUN019]|uniref:hypothetical protein n=1 Tax=Sphingomonas sp. SUN019 TaxID=2937788 RepID=UPI002164D53A|nr:hypothetical protein [Sphingomonas sp. SUN019]UVO52115.1 hypothetical protein M0208_16945 [Sphingomonas sp. SUN019]